MAGPVAVKQFYIVLAAIAVVGGGAIWWLGRGSNTQAGAVREAPTAITEVSSDALPGNVMGSDSARLEVVEYADFQCPACRIFTVLTMPDVVERLVKTGRIRWRFRDFPLPGHDKSPAAHHAAACAGEQGKFWPMHDQLYATQDEWATGGGTDRKMRNLARDAGLDLDRYDECTSSRRYEARLVASREQAAAQGVQSTPTFVIGGVQIAGTIPYDRLRAIIDSVAPPAAR